MADLDFVPDQQQKAMAGALKELGCELPGSLGLGQSYVRPPKTLEGQENRTCSDCCTKRPPYVFFVDLMRSCQEAGMYVCMYVCMCVDETKQLTEEIRRHLMDPVDGRSKRCSRGGDEQGALLWHSGYV